MHIRVKLLFITFLLACTPLHAQVDDFVKLCSAAKLEEPMLLSINSLFKTMRISGARNTARCKLAGSMLAEPSQLLFDTHEMLTVEPLKFFPNIQELYIDGSQDLDLNSFQFVPHLERLILTNIDISDFQFLSYFHHLTELDLHLPNATESRLPPDSLRNLKRLALSNFVPVDWNELATATKVKSIQFYFQNKLSVEGDWLQSLTQLLSMQVINAQMSAKTIEGLSRLTNLETLIFNNVNLDDVEFVKFLTNLQHLSLIGTGIVNFPPLDQLKKLEYLDVSNNNLTSLEALRNMTSIKNLWLNKNRIADLQVLSRLTKLVDLRINNNAVDSIAPISTLLDLQILDVSKNCIKDFPILRRLQAPHRNSRDLSITLKVYGSDQQEDVCE